MRDAGRYRDALLPLILIVAGVIALILNAHVLSQQAIDNLILLWPLILVVLGVLLVLRALLPPERALPVGIGFALAALAGTLAVAIGGPALVPVGTGILDSSAALGPAEKASLSLDFGTSAIVIRGQDLGGGAYRAHLEYAKAQGVPRIRFGPADNALTVQSGPGTGLFGSGNRSVDLTLSTHVPWSLSLQGGAGNVQLATVQLQVSDLRIAGGAGDIEATLSPPRGTAVIDVSGGAGDLTLHLPRGVQWRVQVSGGASSINLDGQELDGVNQVSRSSSGFGAAADRYDVQISGGVSDVTLDTNGSGG